jgi:hypothetical protein
LGTHNSHWETVPEARESNILVDSPHGCSESLSRLTIGV